VNNVHILACDIGGTKTDVAVFSAETGLSVPIAEETYHSQKFPDLQSILQEFLAKKPVTVESASCGVAEESS
jgi:glucokinase